MFACALALGFVCAPLGESTEPGAVPSPPGGEEVRDTAAGPAPGAPDAALDEAASADDDEDPAWLQEVRDRILPLLDENRFDQAREVTETLVKAHPEMPEEDKARLLLHVIMEAHIAKADAAAALKAVDEIIAAYPDANLGGDAPEIKRHIRTRIDSQQADEVMEKLAPLAEKERDRARLRAAAEGILAERPQMNQNAKAIVMFRILVEPLVESGDEAAALRELAALAATFPESDFVKEADSFKADMLERIEERKVAAIMKRLDPLIEAGELAKAREEAEKHFAEHPEWSQNTRAAVLFQVVVLPRVMAGDAEAAAKELEALVKTYPESDLAKEAADIRNSIQDAIEVQGMLRDMVEEDDKATGQPQEPGDAAEAPANTGN